MIVECDNDNGASTLSEEELTRKFLAIRGELLCFLRTKDYDQAEDFVSATFIRILVARPRYKHVNDSGFKGWVFTIARNEFLSGYRKTRRMVQDTDNVYTANIAVEGLQEESYEIEQLTRILRTMPKLERELVTAIGILGLTYDEVAAKYSMPVGTLKSKFNRTKELIRQAMEPDKILGYVEPVKEATNHDPRISVLYSQGKSIKEIAAITGHARSHIMSVLGT